ncbi:MAG: hypothetical protein LC623_06895 [Halobacteriales archaeon]|nr:hypothetical protein [Halobacteriales archaeon]
MTRLALVLGVLPFLPPGRGALILMLGGLVVLPVSLLMSRMGARPVKAQPRHAPLEFVAVPAAPPPVQAAQWQPVEAPAQPAHAAPVAQAAQALHPRVAHHAAQAARPWGGTGLERALRQAVGGTHLLLAEPGRYVVRLGRCDSCARHLHACEAERAALQQAVAAYLRDPHVAEVACGRLDRRTTCTFDIRGR